MEITLEVNISKRQQRYCCGSKEDNHIRIAMLWEPPNWVCDVCGRRIYDGFRKELEDWNHLYKKRQSILDRLDREKELYMEFSIHLTSGGILSSITQKYDTMLLGLPRGSDVSDKTGDMVSGTEERKEYSIEKIQAAQAEYKDICSKIARIEAEVNILDDDHRIVLVMFFRDKVDSASIASKLRLDDSVVYKRIKKAVRLIDKSVWRL